MDSQPVVLASERRCLDAPRLRATEFVRRMRGGSQPWLLRCDDAQYYVVKLQNNPQHVRVLANEMLAARLAALVGLPAAKPAFIEIPPELTEAVRSFAPASGMSGLLPTRGLHFGSCLPGDPAKTLILDFLPDRFLTKAVNLHEAFLGGFVFDKWTCNCDGRQFIFHRRAEEKTAHFTACMIDHGFCFNDGEWSFCDSPARSIYPRRLVYAGVRSLDSFEPFLNRIENLTLTDLEGCARDIPSEWCGEETEGLLRLLELLFARRLGLRQALIDARDGDLRPFPNWK